MIINFECKRCHRFFNSDVGSVTLPEDSERPHFEKMPLCPTCGELTIDDVWLTELGQSQLTEAIFDFGGVDFFESIERECLGCDQFLPVNDLDLCAECAAKLERDLIRQRDWDYSITAYTVDPSKREELRRQVIAQYGEKFELIAHRKEKKGQARKQRRRGTKRKSR
ncbi:MAG: hypothetical protein AB1510_10045 [Bacillota bacterium]